MVERKKTGQPKARKKNTWVKRTFRLTRSLLELIELYFLKDEESVFCIDEAGRGRRVGRERRCILFAISSYASTSTLMLRRCNDFIRLCYNFSFRSLTQTSHVTCQSES